MALILPRVLDADTLPVVLARIGTPLKGDSQLHMLARKLICVPGEPVDH
jgi:hypothetical protein